MTKSELASILAKYNTEMGWATIAVAVGILGEYIAHFVFTKEKKGRAEWVCTLLFAILVIGGVSGEYWYGKQLSGTADSLQRIADSEVAAASQKASEADAVAQSARSSVKGYDKQIADDQARIKTAEAAVASAKASVHEAVAKLATADARIAEAETRAKEADSHTADVMLELAKLKLPRILDFGLRDRLAKSVGPFSGQQFAPYVFNSQESFDLWRTVEEILTRAGWKRVEPTKGDIRLGDAGLSMRSKVIVEYASSQAGDIEKRAAHSISEVLAAGGIEASAVMNPELESTPRVLNVIIGSKLAN
jgi:multidrug efflux pump subunit AcrA (membrane-fusion protein)